MINLGRVLDLQGNPIDRPYHTLTQERIPPTRIYADGLLFVQSDPWQFEYSINGRPVSADTFYRVQNQLLQEMPNE